jgi:multidrug efflux pump subunit AcrA (membrane-fusion protein)
MFVLVASSPMRLAIDVPERHAGAVRAGTVVRVRGEDGAEIEGTVARLAPVVDPASRTFRAEVEVPAGQGLLPGMYARARLDLGAVDDAVRVPRAAVFEVLGRARVVQVLEGRAQPHDVEMIAEEDGAAIVRGLAPSAEVVARSPGLLAPGTEIVASGAARAGDSAASAGEPSRGGGGT